MPLNCWQEPQKPTFGGGEPRCGELPGVVQVVWRARHAYGRFWQITCWLELAGQDWAGNTSLQGGGAHEYRFYPYRTCNRAMRIHQPKLGARKGIARGCICRSCTLRKRHSSFYKRLCGANTPGNIEIVSPELKAYACC